MSKYKTKGWDIKSKQEQIADLFPRTPFAITSEGEFELDIERDLTLQELSKLETILGKLVEKK